MGGGGTGMGARRFARRAGSALGVWQAEAADGISLSGGKLSDCEGPDRTPLTAHCAASVCGTDALADLRSIAMRDRVTRAARQDAHSLERDDGARLGWAQPGFVGLDSRQEHIKVAARLIRDVGFDPVDAGPLLIARYTESFGLLIAQLAYEREGGPELAYRFERFGK